MKQKQGLVKRKFESFGFSTTPVDLASERRCLLFVQNMLQVGNDFQLQLYSWMKISNLKQQVEKKTGLCQADFRLIVKNQELTLNNYELSDYNVTANSVVKIVGKHNIQQKYEITQFDILESNQRSYEKFVSIKWDVEGAFSQGIIPKLTDFGTQGTYLLEGMDRRKHLRKYQQLLFIPNNPRGYVGKMNSPGLRSGVLSGEGVDREVAAYLIDEAYGGYHSVPITTFVQIIHPSFKGDWDQQFKQIDSERVPIKFGSFQLYMKHDDNAGNYGSSLFPAHEARKIAMLDIRILNCDRNEENILVRKKKIQQSKNPRQAYDFELIPIDHGYSFPDKFQICRDEVVWYHWDQMTQPFTIEEREYIKTINPQKDVQLIRSKLKFREICLRNFRISTTLLQQGADAGLTIHDISELLFREDSDILSPIEICVQQAEENYELGNRIPNKIIDLNFKKSLFKNNLIQKSLEFKSQNNSKDDGEPKKLQRVFSKANINNKEEKKKNSFDQQWDEEFYQHFEWFLRQIIDSKSNESKSPPKKNYRERYNSENYQ